jgi:ring-1,2-phenylacetyl-CoA epoxidase subunit PaaB
MSEVTAEHGRDTAPPRPRTEPVDHEWPLYEVFVRGKRGLNHVHVGSLHAADDEMALRNARDLYTRRNEGVSIWVVRATAIVASSPDEKDPFFAPSGDKVYRHPTFYEIPDNVPHM